MTPPPTPPHHTGPADADPFDELIALRQAQQARRTREVADLLAERAELRGVHALADLVSDQASWCA